MAIPFDPFTDVPSNITTAEQECYRMISMMGTLMIGREIQLNIEGNLKTFEAFTYGRKISTDKQLYDFFTIAMPLDMDIIANSAGKNTWEYAQGIFTPANDQFPANWK